MYKWTLREGTILSALLAFHVLHQTYINTYACALQHMYMKSHYDHNYFMLTLFCNLQYVPHIVMHMY